MKIKRTVYHKEGYKKIGQEVEFELTLDELREAYEEMAELERKPNVQQNEEEPNG